MSWLSQYIINSEYDSLPFADKPSYDSLQCYYKKKVLPKQPPLVSRLYSRAFGPTPPQVNPELPKSQLQIFIDLLKKYLLEIVSDSVELKPSKWYKNMYGNEGNEQFFKPYLDKLNQKFKGFYKIGVDGHRDNPAHHIQIVDDTIIDKLIITNFTNIDDATTQLNTLISPPSGGKRKSRRNKKSKKRRKSKKSKRRKSKGRKRTKKR
jgi:hypothetical protein